MIICGILAYPIAKILDYILGEHHIQRFCNTDLKTLIDLHSKRAFEDIADQLDDVGMRTEGLNMFQTEIVKGAIDLNKTVKDIMIGPKDIFQLSLTKELKNSTAKRLAKRGFSRIPIYARKDKHFLVGVLLIKQLIGLEFEGGKTIEDMVKSEQITLRKPLFCREDDEIGNILIDFKNGRSHMAIVTDDPEGMERQLQSLYDDDSLIYDDDEHPSHEGAHKPRILGLVTIEDIIEEIMNDEIYDELDYDHLNNPNVLKLEQSVDRSQDDQKKDELMTNME